MIVEVHCIVYVKRPIYFQIFFFIELRLKYNSILCAFGSNGNVLSILRLRVATMFICDCDAIANVAASHPLWITTIYFAHGLRKPIKIVKI